MSRSCSLGETARAVYSRSDRVRSSRALLTSAQLSTYYVGHAEMADTISALISKNPNATERDIHDTILSHGSPPPRHLRALLHIDAP